MKRSTAKQVAVAAGVVGLVVLVAGWFVWWGRPPQMGTDEEAFKAVDALFTAVTARDEQLLGRCAQRLRACTDAGRLPADASDYLDGVIGTARSGRWEAAAERLYDFMRAQRREGEQDHARKKERSSPKSARR